MVDRREQLAAILALPAVTQERVAEEAGVTQPWICQMLGGHVPVTAEALRAGRIVRRRAIGEGLLGLGMRLGSQARARLEPSHPGPELLQMLRDAASGVELALELFTEQIAPRQREELKVLAVAIAIISDTLEGGNFAA